MVFLEDRGDTVLAEVVATVGEAWLSGNMLAELAEEIFGNSLQKLTP